MKGAAQRKFQNLLFDLFMYLYIINNIERDKHIKNRLHTLFILITAVLDPISPNHTTKQQLMSH